MMYILATWTGSRKGEIGSLALRSLRLDDDPPTATVAAAFSKHRAKMCQVLHPELVKQSRVSLASKSFSSDKVLFPIFSCATGGVERKTLKMIKRGPKAALQKWYERRAT